jgi:BASS family bile acid:Na+ symporter
MEEMRGPVTRFAHFVHRHFLWLVTGSYVAAAVVPTPGLWLRGVRLGAADLSGEHAPVTLPMLLLALLLLNAGLGIPAGRLRRLARNPLLLTAGLAANLLVPVLFILGVSQSLRLWHNPDEVQNILVGLALVASMPVAGSSAAWSQNADGDLALSLGLVVFSTCLSPLTTPAALHAVGWMAAGVYADSLHALAAGGTGAFLAAFVLLPSLAGIGLRTALGEDRLARAKPGLKLLNSANLLLLCYANASAALPQVVADPDWDFLTVMLAVVVALCALAFASGWLLARLFRADGGAQTSLMFGLGMNNNGTGLVLASTALAHLPAVMLPVICYNLVQHVVAGFAAALAGPCAACGLALLRGAKPQAAKPTFYEPPPSSSPRNRDRPPRERTNP